MNLVVDMNYCKIKESINVCREALTDDLASTMAKVRAVKYTNRGSIPRKGKEFSLHRKVLTQSR
jgi:hypothetical protein